MPDIWQTGQKKNDVRAREPILFRVPGKKKPETTVETSKRSTVVGVAAAGVRIVFRVFTAAGFTDSCLV